MNVFSFVTVFGITAFAACGGGNRRLEDDEYDPRECWTDLVGWWHAELWIGAAEKGECADPEGAEERFEIRKTSPNERIGNNNIKIGFESYTQYTSSMVNYDGFEFQYPLDNQDSEETEVPQEPPKLLETLIDGALAVFSEPSEPVRQVDMHFDDEHNRMFLTFTCGEVETTVVYKQCNKNKRRKKCMFYISVFLAFAAICCLVCVGRRRMRRRQAPVLAQESTSTAVNLTKTIAIAKPVTASHETTSKVTPGGEEITAVTVAYTDDKTTHTV